VLSGKRTGPNIGRGAAVPLNERLGGMAVLEPEQDVSPLCTLTESHPAKGFLTGQAQADERVGSPGGRQRLMSFLGQAFLGQA